MERRQADQSRFVHSDAYYQHHQRTSSDTRRRQQGRRRHRHRRVSRRRPRPARPAQQLLQRRSSAAPPSWCVFPSSHYIEWLTSSNNYVFTHLCVVSVHFYHAMRMHSADYAVARCLSVCPSVSLAISEIFSVKEWPDLEIWGLGCSRSLKMAQFHRPCMTFY